MNGSNSFTRLLSIRGDKRRYQPKNSLDISNLFVIEERTKRLSKEEEKKVQELSQRLTARGIKDVPLQRIEYCLRSQGVRGDIKEAFKLLMLYEDSVAGVLRPYDPNIKMLGAENREKTTCYIDSLLFAMFAKSDVFEAILFNNFKDEPRTRLVTVIRLWVNLLRSGRLVTTDITARLQESLAACGWEDASRVRQQDVSEAFAFITDKLELPLLTLKTDIYHSGTEDLKDDHKFITERMLDVALPENVPPGVTITLEMCLEEYFNNKVEVKRHLQRQLTAGSMGARRGSTDKLGAVHVESVEVESRGNSPTREARDTVSAPVQVQRPLYMRTRATSIFSERKVPLDNNTDKPSNSSDAIDGRGRANSARKEVSMPAWQFLNLIPWYADNAVPENDAQVRQHFSTKRPMLGICLKRYAVTPNGMSHRIGTHIDIPLDMACPHFDSGDKETEGPSESNFKLALQSVVCHRGHSVEAGHYVSLVRAGRRGTLAYSPSGNNESTRQSIDYEEDTWLLLDDLAYDRVRPVDIDRALKEESPYLLFYRVQPVDDDGASSEAPPPYAHSEESFEMVDEKLARLSQPSNTSEERSRVSMDGSELPSRRGSGDATSPSNARGRTSINEYRRSSIQWQDGRATSRTGSVKPETLATEPTTPLEESRSGSSTVLSRVSTKGGKVEGQPRPSREVPHSAEKRSSVFIGRITSKMNKDRPTAPEIIVQTLPDTISTIPIIPTILTGRASKDASPDAVRLKMPKEKEKEKRRKFPGSRRGSGQKSGKQPDRDCIVM